MLFSLDLCKIKLHNRISGINWNEIARRLEERCFVIMEELRILYGTSYDRESEGGIQFYDNLAKVYTVLINNTGEYTVGKLDFVFSKTKLLEKLAENEKNYNVIISDGTIYGTGEDGEPVRDGIGFSTIKGWLTDRPDTKVIIIEDSANRGKAKIGRLFKELCFYNIVFKPEEFTWKPLMTEVVNVLKCPRTAKEALAEYGIAEYEDVKEYLRENPWVMEGGVKPVVESVSSINNSSINDSDVTVNVSSEDDLLNKENVANEAAEVAEEENNADINKIENVEDKVSDSEHEKSIDEIEAMLAESEKRFANFNEDEVIEEFAEPDDVEELAEEEKRGSTAKFDFSEFGFGGSEVSDNSNMQDKHDDEGGGETVNKFSFEFGTAGQDASQNGFAVENETVEEGAYREVEKIREVMVFNRRGTQDSGLMPTKGFIRAVVDYDTILLEFDNEIGNVENLDEYRCIVKVRSGMKGKVINGRYKSANISFDAYLETIVDSRTAMMEVPEFDCEEKREFLEGKECNFVFVKM